MRYMLFVSKYELIDNTTHRRNAGYNTLYL